MRATIENMESRALLSASAAVIVQDLYALKAVANTATTDVQAGLRTVASDVKAIRTAVNTSHPTKLQRQALASFVKQETAAVASYKKLTTATIAPATRDAAGLVNALRVLKAHPSYAALNKVHADFAALSSVFSTQAIAASESAAAGNIATIEGQLNTLVATAPAAGPAASVGETHLAADLTTMSTDLTAIQAAVTKLGADLP